MRVSRSLCRLHNPSQNCGSKIRQHLNKSEYCNVRYAVDSKSHWLISAPVIFVDVMEPHRLCSKCHLFRTLAWQGPFHFAKMYSLVFRSISFTPLPHLLKCSTCSTAVLVWCVCVCPSWWHLTFVSRIRSDRLVFWSSNLLFEEYKNNC
jgi:hypothetical protein